MAGDRSDQLREVTVLALAAPGGHYSHAVIGAGLVFVAGQLPIARDGTRRTDATFDEQARLVLANVEAALQAAGSGIERVLQVRVYLADIADWPAFNALHATWAGSARPARAIVPTGPLHVGFRIEIEAVALAA
jgi:reactive intermediate/imine deaminase